MVHDFSDRLEKEASPSVRVEIEKLIIRRDIFIRSDLNEDAVQRYMDLYLSGKEKAIKVQAGTNIVIDGFHRLKACERLGLKKILAEYVEADEKDLRALAYKYNRIHGVPLTREERNKLIADLYFKDGWTQQQIADLVGLSQNRVSEILVSSETDNSNNSADKRRELKPEDYPAIGRLILGGEKQRDVAEKFGVSQGRISQVWAEFWARWALIHRSVDGPWSSRLRGERKSALKSKGMTILARKR